MFRTCPGCGGAVMSPNGRAARCPSCSTMVGPPSASIEGHTEAQRAVTLLTSSREHHGRQEGWERLLHHVEPTPWDDGEAAIGARVARTLFEVSVRPRRFFRAMAEDCNGGAIQLALASIAVSAGGLAYLSTWALINLGSRVSPGFIALETFLAWVVALALLAVVKLGVLHLALGKRHRRPKDLRRLVAFSCVPLLWGAIPGFGFLAGAFLGARALAIGLQERHHVSLGWSIALAFGVTPIVLGAVSVAVMGRLLS
ncbi:MAG: hypothetical protein HC923_07605 [Myxococcales bacterium]|nr:hypothetical protein [Myxococcales bacterium]